MNSFLKNHKLIDSLIIVLIVSILFSPTLNRPWLIYDESLLYNGKYFGFISSIGEFIEYILNFGLNFNLGSSNSIYSSNHVIRNLPLAQILGTALNSLLNKNAFYYHILNLALHLINSIFVFSIIDIIFNTSNIRPDLKKRLIIICLSLIWAIHPVIMESVLLSTNFAATINYIFYFFFIRDFLLHRSSAFVIKKLFIPILFLFLMFITEHIVALPLILFIYSFFMNYKTYELKASIKNSILETLPYFLGLFIYMAYFFFFSNYETLQSIKEKSVLLTLERIFWLSPQIFFHFIKLIVFPKILSIDQSIFLKLGKSLFDTYSVFCFSFLLLWLFIPLFFFLFKKKFGTLFFISWGFFVSLIPFLHILLPSYALVCERYLYTPLAILIFGMSVGLNKKTRLQRNILFILIPVIVLCFFRSYLRTQDFKDNISFINSSYKFSKDPFHKAIRLGMLGKTVQLLNPNEKEKSEKYFIESIKFLDLAREDILKGKKLFGTQEPNIIKSYGLGYDSTLSKIAFLKVSSQCLELRGNTNECISILKPHLKNSTPSFVELYTHLNLINGSIKKAKEALLKSRKIYKNDSTILRNLFNISLIYEEDVESAKFYLEELLKYYGHDLLTLDLAITFYRSISDQINYARYSYLYGLRTKSKEAFKNAYIYFINSNENKMAQKSVQKLLVNYPNDPESFFIASNFYYRINDNKNSVNYLEKAHKVAKKYSKDENLNFNISISLAKMYFSLGRLNDATNIIKEAEKYARTNNNYYELALFFKLTGLKELEVFYLGKIKRVEN